jgi:hypothetical protein
MSFLPVTRHHSIDETTGGGASMVTLTSRRVYWR